MSDIRLVSYKNTSMEDALKEAKKLSSETKGNEAIVDLGDGNLAIVSIDENEEEISNISANNSNVAFEDKIKGKLQEAKLNTSANFNPQIMEFSVQESSFFGLVKKGDKTVNYNNNKTDLVDNKISDTEIKSKNEFRTLKEAESAAKSRTGVEAIVYDEKTQKFHLVKVSDENLNKYTQIDEKTGNRVFKSEENLDSKLLDVENSKGKKVVSFVLPEKMMGVINTENVLRRTGAENIQNINLNTQKEQKINVNTNSLEGKLQDFSKVTINTETIKDPRTKILLSTANEFKDPSFMQNVKKLVENSDALFVNTSATDEEKTQIKSELEKGFKDLETVLSKLSENPSNEEIEKFIKDNPDMVKNIMSVKYAAAFSGSNVKDGSVGNILVEKNRIEKDLKSEGKGADIKEMYKRLSQSSNLSNGEKLWLASAGNQFLDKKVQSIDSKMKTEVIKDIDKLKSIDSKISDLDVNHVLDDIAQNGINSTNIEELKNFVNTAKNMELSPTDMKTINNISNDIKRYESSKVEADLAIKDALATNQTFINQLTEIQRTLDPNDKAANGMLDYLIGIQSQYQQILSENPPNSSKIATFAAYMNKVTETVEKIKNGTASTNDLLKVEQDAQNMFAEYDKALQSGSVEEAKSIMLNAYKNFVGPSGDTKNFETLVNNTKSVDNLHRRIHNSNPSENNVGPKQNTNTTPVNTNINLNPIQNLNINNIYSNQLPIGGVSSGGLSRNLSGGLNLDIIKNNYPTVLNTYNTNNFDLQKPELSSTFNLYNQPNTNSAFNLFNETTPNGAFNLFNQPNTNIGFNTSSFGLGFNTNFNTQLVTGLSQFNKPPSYTGFNLSGFNSGGGFNLSSNSEFTSRLNTLSGIIQNDSSGLNIRNLLNSSPILPILKNSTAMNDNLSSKLTASDLNSSALQKSVSQNNKSTSTSSTPASNAEKALAANLAYSDLINSEIEEIEQRAEQLEAQVSQLYDDFDGSAANIANLLESFRTIISEAESEISDIKNEIKKKLSVQLNNIMSITDTSKRRKLLDKLKEMDNELFVNSKEVQMAMKTYMEKSQHLSTELKSDDVKKVLDAYKKVLSSYNTLQNEKDPEKFLDKLDKYNDNLKTLSNILNGTDKYDNKDSQDKFKLLNKLF